MRRKLLYRRFYSSQEGMSLLEVMIALAILLIASVGIMTMGTVAIATTENQGHLAARTARIRPGQNGTAHQPCVP